MLLKRILKEDKKAVYIFAVEMFMLLTAVIMLIIPKEKYNIPTDNPEEYVMDLRFGRYMVDIDYDVVEDNVMIVPTQLNANSWYNGKVITQGMILSHQFNEESFELWVTGLSSEVCIKAYHFNDIPVNFNSITVKETNYTYWCLLFAVIGIILITYTICLIKNKLVTISRNDVLVILALMGIIILSSLPIFTKYLTVGFDTFFHIVRIEGVKDGLLAGQFPVKVEPTYQYGHGYAVSIFYGGLFFYIPALMRLMGFNLQFTYKIFVLLISTSMALSSYFLFKEIGKKRFFGIIGSALYTLSVYKFCTSYYRGAVAETIGMAILPIIVLGLWNVYTKPYDEKYSKRWLLPTIGFTAVIQSHILSTEIYGFITVIVCILLWKKTFKKDTFIVLLKIVIFTVLINIWFIVPWFDCMNELQMPCNQWGNVTANIQSGGIKFSEMFRFQTAEYNYEIWYMQIYLIQYGISIGLAALVSIVAIVYQIVKKKFSAMHIFWVGLSVVVTFLTTNLFPWDAIITFFKGKESTLFIANMISNLQYPYRIAPAAIIFIIGSMIIGLNIIKDNEKVKRIVTSVIVVIGAVQFTILASSSIATEYNSKEELSFIDELSGNYTPIVGNGEYMPLNVFKMWGVEDTFKILNYYKENVEVSNFHKKYTNASFNVKNNTDGMGLIEVALLYYPGYTAIDTITGNKVPLMQCNSNRIGILVGPGVEMNIEMEYTGKTVWKIAEIISLLSIIGIILYYKGKLNFVKKFIFLRNIKN